MSEPSIPSGARPHRHRRRWVVVGVVAAVVVGFGAFVVVRLVQGRARPVKLSEVAVPTGSTLPSNGAVLRPPQGVYRYRGTGRDHLSKPDVSQSQGPTMPGTITHEADGCWTFRIDYSTNHWQSWRYCPSDGGMGEAGGQTFQRWNFGAFVNETTSTFECDAAVVRSGQRPGDEWRHRCTGTSTGVEGTTTSAGPFRYVGTETLTIGGRKVAAYRYHRERTTSGNQTGTEVTEAWFAVANGMPLRNERHLEATTDTIIGKVDYTEDGEFQLADLEPERR
jgi:hypothetical protein